MGKKRFDYEKYNKDKEEARKFFNKLLEKQKKKEVRSKKTNARNRINLGIYYVYFSDYNCFK